jgi:hypothetical protein
VACSRRFLFCFLLEKLIIINFLGRFAFRNLVYDLFRLTYVWVVAVTDTAVSSVCVSSLDFALILGSCVPVVVVAAGLSRQAIPV